MLLCVVWVNSYSVLSREQAKFKIISAQLFIPIESLAATWRFLLLAPSITYRGCPYFQVTRNEYSFRTLLTWTNIIDLVIICTRRVNSQPLFSSHVDRANEYQTFKNASRRMKLKKKRKEKRRKNEREREGKRKGGNPLDSELHPPRLLKLRALCTTTPYPAYSNQL